jgi:hypothetical protein
MNRPIHIVVHGVIALTWISLALGICLKMALLGNEKATMARQRGEGLKIRTDLICKQDRLRAAIEQMSTPAALEEAARLLKPPLLPGSPSGANQPTQTSVAMSAPSQR